jgi:hypothetical protein
MPMLKYNSMALTVRLLLAVCVTGLRLPTETVFRFSRMNALSVLWNVTQYSLVERSKRCGRVPCPDPQIVREIWHMFK